LPSLIVRYDFADVTLTFPPFTCFKWISLFEICNFYDLIYHWLQFIRDEEQADALGFVIMPNHVHLLLQLNSVEINLNTMMSNAKRSMAYELIRRLEEKEQQGLLDKLSQACSFREIAKGQKHKVSEPSFDAKPVYTKPFFPQKLNVIIIRLRVSGIKQ
jgi:putative transposase